jgi:Protein of unknown function (DUF3768)
MTRQPETARIRELNDLFRSTFIGGKVFITQGVNALGDAFEIECVEKVQTHRDFAEGNDPHGEHDFGAFDVQGRRVFWKIDYYDLSLAWGSENPADAGKTTRVLTIMLAEEY